MWALCFQFFVAEEIARLGWPGHYSMTGNWISDLGAAYSPLHSVMNGSFVLQGFLISVGAVLVHGLFPPRWTYWLALLLLVISGVGVLVVGLVPEDADLPLHGLGATVHLLAGNLAMFVLGLVLIRRSVCGPRALQWKSWITFAAGSVGLLALFALGMRSNPAWAAVTRNQGVVERLAAYPLPLWLTWTGWLMLRAGRTSR